MSTARTLIKDALRQIGAVAQSEEPTADEAMDALSTLNGLLFDLELRGITAFREEVRASSDLTAVSGQIIRADTGAGGFTVTLPLRPNDSDRIAITDEEGTFGASNLTVQGNGAQVEGADTLILNVSGARVELSYRADMNSWEILQQPGPDSLRAGLTIDDPLAVPRTHEWGLTMILAEALAPQYEKPIPAQVARDAERARVRFLAHSRRTVPTLKVDVGLSRIGEIRRRRFFA